jgi:hypothetical protein
MISKEQIATAYKSAPEGLQNIFFSEDFAKSLSTITKKYHLHIDQSGVLSEQVSAVILGLIKINNFNHELRQSLGISEDETNLIIYDLNQLLFSKIRKTIEENSPETHQDTPSTTTVFDAKMHGVANVPKQEVAVTPQTSDNKVRDPYREPTI